VTSPDPDREIYPSAPLKLVTFELRFQPIDLQAAGTKRFVESVAERFPIPGPAPVQQLVLGLGGPSASQSGARVFDSARRQAAGLGPQSLTFETSAYTRFEELRSSIAEVVEAVEALDLAVTATRMGLRYIDEIDEELLPEPGAWDKYIEPALSGALRLFDPPPVEHQSAALFDGDDGNNVVLRYGLMRQPAVDPTGALVIESPPRGRYYLIDIDSAWVGNEHAAPLTTWVLERLGELHAPIRHLFERSITEVLRNEVLRKERP
jgi:uncharacterized protein (TIGR04255 family)